MSAADTKLPVPPLDWVRQAGKVDLVLHDIEQKLRRRRNRRRKAAAAALGVMLAGCAAFWSTTYVRNTDTLSSPAARRGTVALADGSSAELNARTELHTDFRYGRRHVRLARGEAFFAVTKDPGHPFLVETTAGTVRVTGTQFNVRLKEDGGTEVTLLEGAVNFQGKENGGGTTVADSPVALLPGQQLDSADPVPRTLRPETLAGVTAWREGRLVLDGLTLAEAAARLSAYHDRPIAVAAEVAGLRMGGSCSLDDLPGFLEFLPKALSVRVLTRGEGPVRIIAR